MPIDQSSDENKIMSSVDGTRRESLRRLLVGSAYAVPAIATFSLSGLTSTQAHAYGGNG
jgi:hypothetical protein